MELKEWWDVEIEVIPEESIKYDKKLLITIKNHSPFNRKFRITLTFNFKDKVNVLRFLDFDYPTFIDVEKYRKRTIEIQIPRLLVPDKPEILIEVENIDKKEKKSFLITL